MSHRRAQIRNATVATLTGLMTTGSRVRVGQVYPETYSTLADTGPTIEVETLSEALADGTVTGTVHGRDLILSVIARAAGIDWPDTLDQVCLEVETAIMADPKMGGLAEWTEIQGTEIEGSNEIDAPVGVAQMEWRVQYRVDATDPQ